MHIIKVNATESTNSLAREWFNTNKNDSPICIVANNQTSGRGQRRAAWVSNAGENLTFSVIYPKPSVEISNQFLISAAVGLQLIKAESQRKPYDFFLCRRNWFSRTDYINTVLFLWRQILWPIR
jgi:BirA family biotin operon repressor/biotin-[acetyl-CoA-carboxylase] ligase